MAGGALREEITRDEAMTKLGESLRGTLIGRDPPRLRGHTQALKRNDLKRPLMIARCSDVADVITAVNLRPGGTGYLTRKYGLTFCGTFLPNRSA